MPEGEKAANDGRSTRSKAPARLAQVWITKLFGLATQMEELGRDMEGFEQYEKLMEEKKSLKRELTASQKELEDRNGRIKMMEKEIEEQKRKSSVLLESFGEKFRELHVMEGQLSFLKGENTKLKLELETASRDGKELTREVRRLEASVSQRDVAIQRMKEKLAKAVKINSEQNKEMAGKEAHLRWLERQCSEMREDLGDCLLQDIKTKDMWAPSYPSRLLQHYWPD